ncbi:MAG: PD40 domain-containing protein [Candidatus Latescibacteria bacterium]|nr:PD40 domain-containing protein [Candidatus Latescibacterota bacterium]
MKRFHFTSPRMLIVGLLLVIVGAYAVVSYARKVKDRKRHALFVGPSEVSKIPDRPYTLRSEYDLRAYTAAEEKTPSAGPETEMSFPGKAKPSDAAWIEGATREQFEAMRQERRMVDAATGATQREDRLRWRDAYRERVPSRVLWISYPPDGAVFPPNLCEPRVEWDDEVNDLWQVTVGVTRTAIEHKFVTTERQWQFPKKLWSVFREKAVMRDAWIQIKGVRRPVGDAKKVGAIQAAPIVHFRISQYPADNYVVYRLVVPQFQAQKTPDTFIRDLRSFEQKPFLSTRQRYCFSCHTFSSKRGTDGMMSIKMRLSVGKKKPVGLGIVDMASGKGWKARFPFEHKGFTYMGWNSGGDKLVISANQAFSSSRPLIHETQELEYSASDIAIYDIAQERVALLPGANSPDFLEIYPAWTPDDQRIVFSRVQAGVSARTMKFDLYVVDYADGKGGVPTALEGASQNAKSNYFARFSPDGKWLSFCMADQGSLIEPSSDIYVLPADLQGPAHRLESNADDAADSWHSWSSNSHWLIFTSKRDDGVFARLYLTEIDAEGHASPAVRLPLEKPPLECFNLPEFLNERPRIPERQIFEVVRAESPTKEIQKTESEKVRK